ncbi:MAG: TetR family transcriptional regulator [Nocardia sp.]|nr:TetR family transcriptional regulator [Nocardia sp.]
MSDGGPMTAPSGRRAGKSGTREAILEAARERFAEVGFDKAAIRSIAAAAGVDPALIHHYFGTKQQLFAAALNLPIDPETIRGPIRRAPLEELGATVVRTVVGAWDSSIGLHVVAAFRGFLAGGDTELLRTFLLQVALKDVRERVDSPPGTGSTRVALAVSQMLGVLVTRMILDIEPVASMPVEDLTALVGPTMQRYLTGELPVG